MMGRWFFGNTATFPCINGNKLYLQEATRPGGAIHQCPKPIQGAHARNTLE